MDRRRRGRTTRAVGTVAAATALLVSLPGAAQAALDDRVVVLVSNFRISDDVRLITVQADGAERREIRAGEVVLSAADVSPDGSEIASLASPRFSDGPDDALREVRVLAQDGSAQRTLARDATGFPAQGGLTWTNDGTHVAYTSGKLGDNRLALVRRDGRARAAVDTGRRDMQALQWSPDGTLVTFTSQTPEGAVGIFAVAPDGTGLRQLADQSGEQQSPRGLSWSPDSDRFVYTRNAPETTFEPRIVRRDGTVERVLPTEPTGQFPLWSPDGASLTLVREVGRIPTPDNGGTRPDNRVVLVDPDTGAERMVPFVPPDPHTLLSVRSWSPDSRHLLVVTSTPAQPFSVDHLFVVDVETGEGRKLEIDRRVGDGTFAPLPTTPPQARSTDDACEGAPDAGFADTAGSTFAAAIDCVAWYDVARGTSPSTYSPGATVTRAQMAQFLTRVATRAGTELDTRDAGFTDLEGLSADATDAVNAVAHLDVAKGVTATQFAPGAPVTRAQMASFLTRLHRALAEEEIGPRVHCFADVSASVHREAIERLCGAGVGTGVARGSYGAAGAVTRGQQAGFLARLLDVQVEGGRIDRPS